MKSEVAGTALNADAVIKAADAAILSFQPTVSLGEDELAKPTVLSTDERLKTAAETATRMSSVTLKLTMAGRDAGSIGPDQFSQWIKLGDDYNVTLDSDAVNNYVTAARKQPGHCWQPAYVHARRWQGDHRFGWCVWLGS